MQTGNHNITPATAAALLILGAAVTLLSGCTVDSHKQGNGDNVKIATPFGGMSVKTDDNAVEVATGLPAYPGAEVVRKHDKGDHDSGAADINMSFGSFQLRVKAISYRTPDSPDKVLAFYRKNLGRFGTVIQCSNHQPVGTPTHTPDGLDCSDDSENNKARVKMHENFSDKIELKAGSKQHQHLVTIDPEGSGTKFGLVALDLPAKLFGEKDVDDDGNNQPKQ
ncbi:MAG TPA: hypothetical protein VNW54_10850 [Granulicella sp.]|nr:hypothetical protein [Granulicella sp.]